MIPSVQLTPEQIAAMAQHGSPILLQAVGRALGLGNEERAAIAGGMKLPVWFWITIAGAAGLVIGVRVQKRWPESVPEIVSGDDDE